MEDGQTLFDYNVGLNDIVQLLIRSQTDPPDSPTHKDCSAITGSSAPLSDSKDQSCDPLAPLSPSDMETSPSGDEEEEVSITTSTVNETKPDTSDSSSTKNGFSPVQDSQSPTSSKNTLIDPGIGLYKVSMPW